MSRIRIFGFFVIMMLCCLAYKDSVYAFGSYSYSGGTLSGVVNLSSDTTTMTDTTELSGYESYTGATSFVLTINNSNIANATVNITSCFNNLPNLTSMTIKVVNANTSLATQVKIYNNFYGNKVSKATFSGNGKGIIKFRLENAIGKPIEPCMKRFMFRMS